MQIIRFIYHSRARWLSVSTRAGVYRRHWFVFEINKEVKLQKLFACELSYKSCLRELVFDFDIFSYTNERNIRLQRNEQFAHNTHTNASTSKSTLAL